MHIKAMLGGRLGLRTEIPGLMLAYRILVLTLTGFQCMICTSAIGQVQDGRRTEDPTPRLSILSSLERRSSQLSPQSVARMAPQLCEFLSKDDAVLRRRVLHLLSQLDLSEMRLGNAAEQMQRALLPLLDDSDYFVRRQVVELLCDLADVGLELSKEGLNAASPLVRSATATALARCNQMPREKGMDLMADASPRVRIAATYIRADDETLLLAKLKLAEDEELSVAMCAIASLASTVDEQFDLQAVEYLVGLLDQPKLCSAAVLALAQFGAAAKSALPAIASHAEHDYECYNDELGNFVSLFEAASKRIGPATAREIPSLIEIVNSGNPQQRTLALQMLQSVDMPAIEGIAEHVLQAAIGDYENARKQEKLLNSKPSNQELYLSRLHSSRSANAGLALYFLWAEEASVWSREFDGAIGLPTEIFARTSDEFLIALGNQVLNANRLDPEQIHQMQEIVLHLDEVPSKWEEKLHKMLMSLTSADFVALTASLWCQTLQSKTANLEAKLLEMLASDRLEISDFISTVRRLGLRSEPIRKRLLQESWRPKLRNLSNMEQIAAALYYVSKDRSAAIKILQNARDVKPRELLRGVASVDPNEKELVPLALEMLSAKDDADVQCAIQVLGLTERDVAQHADLIRERFHQIARNKGDGELEHELGRGILPEYYFALARITEDPKILKDYFRTSPFRTQRRGAGERAYLPDALLNCGAAEYFVTEISMALDAIDPRSHAAIYEIESKWMQLALLSEDDNLKQRVVSFTKSSDSLLASLARKRLEEWKSEN
ncbi:MAG: hypothetical protein AAF483_07185 [Planctomycetota bacterium]